MVQTYEKLVIKVEFKEKEPEVAQKNKEKKNSSQGISNPRYYENALNPKKAKVNRELQKVHSNFGFQL
jgi:hypothetical protein